MYTKVKDVAAGVLNIVQDKRGPRDLEDLVYKKARSVIVPISEEQRGELLTMTGRPA